MTDKNNSHLPMAGIEGSDRASKGEPYGLLPLRHDSRTSCSPNKSSPCPRSLCRYPLRKFQRSVSRLRSRNESRGPDNRPVAEPGKGIGVFGLSINTNDDNLYKTFDKFGKGNSVKLIMDRYHNESLGYGFVTFDNLESAKIAVKEVYGINLDGRQIRVDFSITKKPHTPPPGGHKGRKPEVRDENRINNDYDNMRPRNDRDDLYYGNDRNDKNNQNNRNDKYDGNYRNDRCGWKDRNDKNYKNDRKDKYDGNFRNNRCDWNARNHPYDRNEKNDRYEIEKNTRRRHNFYDRSRSRSNERRRKYAKYC